MSAAQPLIRYRLVFSKTEMLKYIGHLDLHRIWERSFRRAHLPLAYSQGFHPQPRIQQACALPLGFTSLCEIVDIWLETCCSPNDLSAALQPVLPGGLIIRSVEEVGLSEPPLQTRVQAAQYRVMLLDPPGVQLLEENIRTLLTSQSLLREWKQKTYDLRPLILELIFDTEGLNMLLSAREGATGRPEEVLAVLGIPPNLTRIERKALILN